MEVSGRTQASRVQLGLKLGVEIGYINLRQHRAEEVFIQTRHHNWGSAPYAPRGSLGLECMQGAPYAPRGSLDLECMQGALKRGGLRRV